MTRPNIFAFPLLLVWGLCMIPAQCLAAPPETEFNNSTLGTVPGEARPPSLPDPLARRITRESSADDSSPSKRAAKGSQTGGSMVQTALGLAFVLCLILIAAAWAKRHLPQANKALPSEAVQILGQRPIGQRQMVQLIRCGSRILILGSTPQGLTTLSEVTDPVEVDYLAGLCRQDQPNSVTSAFSRLFQNYRAMNGGSAAAAVPPRSGSAAGETDAPQFSSMHDAAAETPERSLKERLGRLGSADDASRFSPPGAEGSYE